MNPTSILKTENLTKIYKGSKKALDNLSLDVQRGEIFGYLGPNGAGKTTTIRILLDLIRPTSGRAELFGLDVLQHAVEIHKRIGYLPAELNLWQGYKAKDVVRHIAQVRGNVDMHYVDKLAQRFDLDMSKRIREYSTGNKRKIGLVLALMHKPELLILDEPTSGLDPLLQQTFNELMLEWRSAGHTVFLSSHMLNEVRAICDRVAILRDGQLHAVEKVSTLMQKDFRWVWFEFRDKPVIDALVALPGVSDVTVDGNEVKLKLIGDFQPLLNAVDNQYLVNMDVDAPSLEEIFLNFYGDQHVVNGKGVSAKEGAR